jgi:hypothetical protein
MRPTLRLRPDAGKKPARCGQVANLGYLGTHPIRRQRVRLTILTCLILALSPLPLLAGDTPPARNVVVRGGKDLADLLARATADAWRDPAKIRPVAFVVDVTPFTQLAHVELKLGLDRLGDKVLSLDGKWRIAPLGGSLSKSVRHPSKLPTFVDRVLAKETHHVNTFRALSRTLSSFNDRGGVIVYLADWRFEDDERLEAFIDTLKKRGQSLRVIGSESCFARPFLDGLYPEGYGTPLGRGQWKQFEEGIGRNPFGPENPNAPTHTGDTAWQHIPIRWREPPWQTEFHARLPEALLSRLRRYARERKARGESDPEDLLARLPKPDQTDREENYFYPLSSAWGSYGLMRACAETSGHYYLWSFNPFGRSEIRYDYSRCNQFPPDLRPRKTIHAEIPARPLAAALVKAWHHLASSQVRVADASPQLKRDLRTAQPKEQPYGENWLRWTWHERADRQMFLARAPRHLAAMDSAIWLLKGAVATVKPKDDADARYKADAELLLAITTFLRFELAEAIAAAEKATGDLWTDPNLVPGLTTETFIPRERDPAAVRGHDVKLHHPDEGPRMIEVYRTHLRRYGGTPFGELVARNDVNTYRVVRRPTSVGKPDKKTPSQSNDPGKGTPTPGGSGGAGPSTGGK